MAFNHDIWEEIISHLKLEQVDKFDDDAREKALCSLALTSRALSTTALRALWVTIDSVSKKIVPVINSFAPAGEKFVSQSYKESSDTTSWILWSPLTESARGRAKEYLSYVRNLSTRMGRDDVEFWLFLSKCFDLEEALVPKLSWLYIEVSDNSEAVTFDTPAFNSLTLQSLARIVSPTIASLTFEPWPLTDASLIDVIKSSGSDLTHLFLCGPIFPEICTAISTFRNLRRFQAMTTVDVVEGPPPVSIFHFIASLPSLEILRCDTESFVIPSPTPNVISHNMLKELHVDGHPFKIEVLIRGVSLPSLIKLSIGSLEQMPTARYEFHRVIASHLPRIRHLDIRRMEPDYPARLSDLTPLFSLQLESLDCCPVDDAFTPTRNFRTLLESLPLLQHFSMVSHTAYDAFKISVIASQHLQLRKICLTVALRCLLSSPVGAVAEQPPSSSRLTSLSLRCTSEDIPRTEVEYQLLAKKLFLLFPEVSHVRIGPNLEPSRELQLIIGLLRSGEITSECNAYGVE